jgi:hypothetical protein
MPGEDNLLRFLKMHVEDLRRAIERGVKDNLPRSVALKLFEVWAQNLNAGKVVKEDSGIYKSSEPLTLKQLEEKFPRSGKDTLNPNPHIVDLKPHVTHARAALRALSVPVAGQLVSMDISLRQYSICVTVADDPLAARRLIWSSYAGKQPIAVACVKRLFFKVNKDVFVRNITVDDYGDWDKCNVLKSLIGEGPAHAVRLYAPSGEISAAFLILDLFNSHLKIEAVGTLIAPHYDDSGKSLVVLGSGIEEPHFEAPSKATFSLKNFENGIEDVKTGTRYTDQIMDPHLKVYVVVQRWLRSDGSIVTVVYSSHAAAVEAVVKTLVSEPKASELIRTFPRIEVWLRKRVNFECMFCVELDREGTYFGVRNVSVVIPDQRRVASLGKRRLRKKTFKKGA